MGSIITQYTGKQGLQEITEHALSAKDEILIFETSYASLNLFMSQEEAESYRLKLRENNMHVRQLTNEVFQRYSNIEGYHEKVMNVRYISPAKLKIGREILIYDDVVAIYQTRGDNLYGIEINDKDLAAQQKQLFELIWAQADRPASQTSSRTSVF